MTGALDVPGVADPFGFQLTFFRSRTNVPADHPSRFAAKQLVFAHAALTDPVAGKLRHDQRIARVGFGIAQAAEHDTDVQLRGWSLKRDGGPVGSHRYRARIDASAQGFGFDFELAATQPVLLQGDAGYSRKGPDAAQASHYLSEPQLAVSACSRTHHSLFSKPHSLVTRCCREKPAWASAASGECSFSASKPQTTRKKAYKRARITLLRNPATGPSATWKSASSQLAWGVAIFARFETTTGS